MTPYYTDDRVTIWQGDCRQVLPRLPEASAQLVLSSPPYNVGWPYQDADDRLPLDDYLALLAEALAGCYRLLQDGGVLALNVPPDIRTPTERCFPLSDWVRLHLREQGWLLRERLNWVKHKDHSFAYATTTAIGGPRNPYLRPCSEDVILASKGTYLMAGKDSRRWPGPPEVFGSYLELCKTVWGLPNGRTKRGWPLRFPEPLVERLIGLYSREGDVVADPFMGTGTVVQVARRLGRRGLGIELSAAYCADAVAAWAQTSFLDGAAG